MLPSHPRGFLFTVGQHAFYPVLVAVSVVICIALINSIPPDYWLLIPLIMTGIILPVVMLAEKVLPYRTAWKGSQEDSWTDVVRTFIVFPLASLLVLYLLGIVKRHVPFRGLTFPGADSPARAVVENLFFFLVSDFFYYWMHRAFHRSRLLWPFHAIHHGAERVYAINAGKFHFLDAFCGSLAYFLPMVLLGASDEAVVFVMTLSLITGFLEHANIDFKAGGLNYVFNTAEIHRWHHSTDRKESNSNFGKVLAVWDVCFGTFWFPRGKDVLEVGIKNEIIPHSFVKQLLYPFRKRRGRS